MTSGGTRPSTWPITKNGVPMAAGSGSDHHNGGTGTAGSPPTQRRGPDGGPRGGAGRGRRGRAGPGGARRGAGGGRNPQAARGPTGRPPPSRPSAAASH